MLIRKFFFLYFLIAAITLIINTSGKTQDLPKENEIDPQIVDSIDIEENLLDSNEVYKKQFDSLSKDGEWLKTKKSDLIQELENISEEDQDFDYYGSDNFMYVWRPYGINSYWNPYCNGNWIFTNFGWSWNSYYNWGWGPYNYGRWYFSNFYGWVWFPGNVWAPNWVTWRNYNNYVGWYPTCPRVYWRDSRNQIYSNHLFTSDPRNWVFVEKKDFTKKIDKTTIVSAGNNSELLKRSEKIKTTVYTDPESPKIKYSGPDVNIISKESGEKIVPLTVTISKSENGTNEYVKNNEATPSKENSRGNIKGYIPTTKSPVTKTGDNTKKTNSQDFKTKGNNSKTKTGDKKAQHKNTKTRSNIRKGNRVMNNMKKVNPASADIPVENSKGNNSGMPNQNVTQSEEAK